MQGDSEALLRVFIDQAPVPIAMFDMDMRYIAASRRWVGDYHLDERSWRGVSHYEVFPDLPERWRLIHRRALDGEVISSSEDRFEGLSRTVLEVDCRVLGLRSRTGHSISAREPGQELVYCASDELDMRQYVDRRVSPVFRR